jgi:hypothetical protein
MLARRAPKAIRVLTGNVRFLSGDDDVAGTISALLSGAGDASLQKRIDKKIRQAIEDGQFKNLKNSGKPLPSERFLDIRDRALVIANGVLKKSEYKPKWVVRRDEILEDKARIRDHIKEIVELRKTNAPKETEERELKLLVEEVKELNKLISDYNLIAPNLEQQLFAMNIKVEFEIALKQK